MTEDEQVLRGIILKARSPTWWARLSYPEGEWWSADESRLLLEIYAGRNVPGG